MTTISLGGNAADLERRYPEWTPWLSVVETVLRQATDSQWDEFVPEPTEPQSHKVPRLAGATVSLPPAVIESWPRELLRAACQSGAPKLSALDETKQARVNSLDLFKFSLCQDWPRLREIAADLGVDADALQSVAALVAVPFLHACHRRWQSSIPPSWSEGYCPICGAWPAFAEVRGIERSRHLRCGRCGGNWLAQCLVCPYCGVTDHKDLITLVPEKSDSNMTIEACQRCRGYMKTFTTLRGSAPDKVLLDDLASVALDIAALQLDYQRPAEAGYVLEVKVLKRESLGRKAWSWMT